MFHTAGYFRGVSCPFFEHGLCHRPHCHYKHASKPKSTAQRKPPKLNLKHSKFNTAGEKNEAPTTEIPAKRIGKEPDHDRGMAKTEEQLKCDQVKTTDDDGIKVTLTGDVRSKDDEIQSKEDVLTREVGKAIGQLSNFFGSGESTSSHAEVDGDSMITVVSAPEVTGEEITVTDSVPNYAPEKCEVEYPGKGSIEETGKGSSNTDTAVLNLGVSELENMLVTEHDIFGSPDEQVGGGAEEMDTCASFDEEKQLIQDDLIPSTEDLEVMEAEFKRITSQGTGEDMPRPSEKKRKTLDTESTIVDPAAKKRRVAHSNVQMMREPARVTPKAPVIKSNFSSVMDPSSLYLGKKRIAINPAPSNTTPTSMASLTRPKLPLTTNAKIPTSIRQKFLNAFIDEHVKMTANPQEAYDKALEEEQGLFNRSNRRMIYMNLCTLSLKNLREKVDEYLLEERRRSDARVKALLQSEATSPEAEQKSVTKNKDVQVKSIKKKKKKKSVSSSSVPASSPADKSKAKCWESLESELQATFSSNTALIDLSLTADRDVKSMRAQKASMHQAVNEAPGNLSDGIHKEKTNTPSVVDKLVLPCSSEQSRSRDQPSTSSSFKSSQFYSKKSKQVKLKSSQTSSNHSKNVKGSHIKCPPQSISESSRDLTTLVEGQRSNIQPQDMTTELFGEESDDSNSEGVSVERNDNVHSGVSDDDCVHSGMSFESALASGDSSRDGIKTKKLLRPKMRNTPTSLVKGRHTHRDKRGVVKIKQKGSSKGQSTIFKDPRQEVQVSVINPLTESIHMKRTRVQSSSSDSTCDRTSPVDSKGQSSSPDDISPLKSPLLEFGKVPVLKLARIRSPPQIEQKPVVQEKSDLQLLSSEPPVTICIDDPSTVTDEGDVPRSPLTPSHMPSGPFINLTRVAAAQQKKNKMATTMSMETRRELNKLKKRQPKTSSSSSGSVRTKPSVCILKKKEIELTPAVFVEKLKSYLLTEDQLVENGYPRPTEELGMASINRGGETPPIIEFIGSNAVRHHCCRCNKPFIVYNHGQYQTIEECVYHYGRLVKMKEYGEGIVSKYTCCQERRDSTGCQVAKLHVTAGDKPTREAGYVVTTPPPESAMNREEVAPAAYALDCEMCYTTTGLELTRVTVIDVNMRVTYEAIVKPNHPIVDYNTRFSGLTADDFVGVTTTLRDVQERLLQLFYEDTILLGHSLESDLRSLKIIHSCVVDTAIVFPHRKGPPFKRALKTLMAEYLMKFIQDNIDGGHDSLEDSKACMELMMWKVKGDLKKAARRVPEK